MAPWAPALSRFEPTITRWRGSRSAKTPPKSTSSSCGIQPAARTRPRSVAECVRSSTAKASAIGATAVPRRETSWPVNRRRNSRPASGPSLGSMLLPVALQPRVGLPEWHRLLVALAIAGELGGRLGLELLLAGAVADALGPLAQAAAQLAQVALDVTGDAEVDQREALRPSAVQLVERSLPCLQVELGRRGRRQDELAGLDPHARRVACVERAVGVEVADVMPRVPRRREAVETQHALADRVHVRLRHRRELAPETVEIVAVEASRAALEPRGVDQMRRADLRDVHLQAGVLAHEHARRARMVEVDVREQQVPQIAQLEPALREPRVQLGGARRRPTVLQREAVVGLEQVRADHALTPEVAQVEGLGSGHAADRTTRSGPPVPALGFEPGADASAVARSERPARVAQREAVDVVERLVVL